MNKTLETFKTMEKNSTSSNIEKDFLEFLKWYQAENHAEALHDALFILLIDEASPEEFKRNIADALYVLRQELNNLKTKYLLSDEQVKTVKL